MTHFQRRVCLCILLGSVFAPSCSCNGVDVDPFGGSGNIVTEDPNRARWKETTGKSDFGQESDTWP